MRRSPREPGTPHLLVRCLGAGMHPAFTDSICHAVKSHSAGLFLNPLGPDGPCLLHRPSFRSAYGHRVADVIHKVLFCMDHSCFCVGLPLRLRWWRGCCQRPSTRGFAREVLRGGSGDLVPLQPKDAGDLHSLSEVAGWTLIFGTQGDVLLSPQDVIGAVYHGGYPNDMPLPRNGDGHGCVLQNEWLSGRHRFTERLFWSYFCWLIDSVVLR